MILTATLASLLLLNADPAPTPTPEPTTTEAPAADAPAGLPVEVPEGADVRQTASGLVIVDQKAAEPYVAQNGDLVLVHYRGRLLDGKQFDSSYERGEPFDVSIGQGRVIKGWEEGLVGMKPGDKRTLVIPPELGYGERGAGNDIPPNATLIFEIEMLGIYRPPARR